MNTKHLLLTALTAVCLSQTAVAVPAYPHPMKVTQADGTTLTILLRGDEHGHLTLTVDGYPLFFNEQTQNYEYATITNQALAPSGIVATDKAQRPATATAFLATQDREGIFQLATAQRQAQLKKTARPMRAAAQPNRLRITDYPTLGEQHSLVILVEFNDLTFTAVPDANAYFTSLLNDEGFTYSNGANGSARDFYIDSSNGAFQPTFDVVGPVTLSKSYAYYGYGYQDDMNRLKDFVEEAIKAADPSVDFSQYDTDNDGVVDNVYFFYAGKGEADGGSTNTIWPHAFSWQDFQQYYGAGDLIVDGKSMGSYSCSNEINGTSNKVEGIGTFVHEFGHVLGLNDHYDVNYGTASYGYTPDSWDTMDNGSYNNDKNTPPAFSAYERATLGWLTYTELSTQTDTVTIAPVLTDSNQAYVVRVPDKDNEFFVLETRQQKGWDEYLPGHGMLVWHIDEDEQLWENNQVNTDYRHQHIDIVEADGAPGTGTQASDPFPGTKNVTTFTFNSWDGEKLFAFSDVAEREDGTVAFALAGNDIKLDSPAPITFSDVADSTVTVQWTEVKNATSYVVTVTGPDGNALPDYNAAKVATNSITLSGLTPETTYTVAVKAAMGNLRSEEVTATVTTTAIPFSKLSVDPLAASDITTNSFHATWNAISNAQAYEVTLSKRTYAEETTTQGYDFTNGLEGLPELWEVNASSTQSASGYYGDSKPSIRLNTNGMYVKAAYPESKLSSLKFWVRGSQASATSNIVIDRYADGSWQNVDTVACSNTATTLTYSFEQSDSVRIVFKKVNGYVCIDDIYVDCHALVRTPLSTYNALNVGDVLAYDFTGLESDTQYGLTVCGVQNGERSHESAELVVTTLLTNGINAATATNGINDGTTEVYDLQGRHATGKQPGLYILRKDGRTVKTVVK